MQISAPPRADAKRIFEAAVNSVSPETLVDRAISWPTGSKLRISGQDYDVGQGVKLIAFGKASLRMAAAAENKLGATLKEGIVITQPSDEAEAAKLSGMKCVIHTGSPGNLPDAAAEAAARQALSLAQSAGERDLILVLVSGGGSALLPIPAEGLSLEDKRAANQALVRAGASITQLNTIRKHLSLSKGGQLAATASPAKLAALVLSDVIGDPLDVIASGPTVADSSTYGDAMDVVEQLNVQNELPPAVFARLQGGHRGDHGIQETPKPGDHRLAHASTVIVGSNKIAAEAAKREAESLGYTTTIHTTSLCGDTEEASVTLAQMAKEALSQPPDGGEKGYCIILGGETTVQLSKIDKERLGKGGRCTHMALLMASRLSETEGWTLLSAGTDGQDGPTDAAGAFADGQTIGRGKTAGLDPEVSKEAFDSLTFFEAEGGAFKRGLSGTNVMDLHILLCQPKSVPWT